MEYGEFALGLISGLIIAIITQIVAHYFSKKSLDAQQEHSLRIAKMQLYHEDRKNALIKLDELFKKCYKTFSEFRNTISTFLNGSLGLFLPDKLRGELKKEIKTLTNFCSRNKLTYMEDRQKSGLRRMTMKHGLNLFHLKNAWTLKSETV